MATSRGNFQAAGASNGDFVNWSRAISDNFFAFGMVRANDTGQGELRTLTATLTSAVSSGGFATYTYSGVTNGGPNALPLRIGQLIVITGFVNVAFNISGTIVALVPGVSFQLALVGTNALETTTSTGTVNGYSAAPATSTYPVFEIWKTNDGLTPYYIRIDYGIGSTQFPTIKLQLGLGTNGAGVLSSPGTQITTANGAGSTQGASLFDCVFSGSASRFQCYLWRNLTTNGNNIAFSIERSVDTNGNETSDFMMLQVIWRTANSSVTFNSTWLTAGGTVGTTRTAQETYNNNDISTAYQGNIALFPTVAVVGYPRPPLLGFLRGAFNDWNDTDVLPLNVFQGVSHTYFVHKFGAGTFMPSLGIGATVNGNNVLIMRYD